jgi:glycyl-tRNA synthetase beta chain
MSENYKLLLEILTEEVPFTLQKQAIVDIEKLFKTALANNNITFNNIKVYATPRRLTTLISGLPKQSTTKTEEKKGPRVNAKPEAIEGFLRQNNLQQKDLKPTGDFYMANIITQGQDIENIIAGVIVNEVLAKMQFKKSMYWEDTKTKWARPIRNLLCMLENSNNTNFIGINFASVKSNRTTMGHRFLSAGDFIAVGNINNYFEALKENFIILDQNERREYIKTEAENLAKSKGGKLLENWVLDEVNFLNEYPVLLLDSIPQKYLELPPEAIITIMANNQRYLNIVDNAGNLLPHYIIVANNKAIDDGAEIIAGNRKVLVARLEDGLFFYHNDLKTPLLDNVEKLKNITWFEGLGTYYDKVNRMYDIMVSDWFNLTVNPFNKIEAAKSVSFPSFTSNNIIFKEDARKEIDLQRQQELALTDIDKQTLKHLAYLSKADLVSQMVLEMAELQGIMGSYYINNQTKEYNKLLTVKDKENIALAVKTQYEYLDEKLLSLSREKMLAVALILADKIDTLEQMFKANHIPTGSSDPYALRRSALVILKLIINNNLQLKINEISSNKLLQNFLEERLFIYLKEQYKLEKEDIYMVVEDVKNVNYMSYLFYAMCHKALVENKQEKYMKIIGFINRIEPLLQLDNNIKNSIDSINEKLLLKQEEKNLFTVTKSLNDPKYLGLNYFAQQIAPEQLATLEKNLLPALDNFFNANIRINDENIDIKNNRIHLLYKSFNLLKRLQQHYLEFFYIKGMLNEIEKYKSNNFNG